MPALRNEAGENFISICSVLWPFNFHFLWWCQSYWLDFISSIFFFHLTSILPSHSIHHLSTLPSPLHEPFFQISPLHALPVAPSPPFPPTLTLSFFSLQNWPAPPHNPHVDQFAVTLPRYTRTKTDALLSASHHVLSLPSPISSSYPTGPRAFTSWKSHQRCIALNNS